jgi:hypothetical protein
MSARAKSNRKVGPTPRRTRRQEDSFRGSVRVIAIRAFRFAFTEAIELTAREHPTRTLAQLSAVLVDAMRQQMAELERSLGAGGAQS